ncbi:hypothetical protein XU18_1608 [Perkinsela sp. CCAP 1560/4]|nr:hypothetical protein XU18_1608 [Perkinsela sp. CCAP 1560/4]|eukprot:KNH07717.1 hypothetical protein XU18_1608 [Perkinsela sp. CCAP 1560/4]
MSSLNDVEFDPETLGFLRAHQSVHYHLTTKLAKVRTKRQLYHGMISPTQGGTIISFNVGGVIYSTSLAIFDAVPNSLLYYVFRHAKYDEVPRDTDGNPYFDRCGSTFAHILNYLRNPGKSYVENLLGHSMDSPESRSAHIERLFQDMEFYKLHEMKREVYWVLELSGFRQSARLSIRPPALPSRHSGDEVFLEILPQPSASQMGEYRFQNGPGVSQCATEFSQATLVALTRGDWMTPRSTAEGPSKVSPYSTPFPGIYSISVSIESPEGFGIGVVSQLHGNNLHMDFSRTKHCALYCGTRGTISNNMCTSSDVCEVAVDHEDTSRCTLPAESAVTQCLHAEKVLSGDVVGVHIHFPARHIAWMLNGRTVCYSPLCAQVEELKFAVLGRSRTRVKLGF